MGIPSYYKKLLNELPQLIKRSHPDATIEWLFLDFNCLIYHCLHRADTPPYSDDKKDEWEASFIEAIVRYCLKVVRLVQPRAGIYLAIDGVVPMAKMRQQRLRRFKSVWLKQREQREQRSGSWDTNAITPGTVFMQRLHAGLEKMIKENGRGTWFMSSSNEPGEGEHKIMTAWRTGNYPGNIAVYGLDADLIVLSLLGLDEANHSRKSGKIEAWLFREEIDKGAIQYHANGEEQFEWFSIHALESWLTQGIENKEHAREFLLNYGCAMSVLGNDFLPSSLGLKMRDDGHTELLRILRALPLPLVYSKTMELSMEGLQAFFRLIATYEPTRIEKYIQKKRAQARFAIETGFGEINWPLSQTEEAFLLKGDGLHPDWKKKYQTRFFPGHTSSYIVDEYLYGFQWIWAYYTGRMTEICFNWYYPFSLPPLWEWVRDAVHQHALPDFPQMVRVRAEDIRPAEQLALVLPLESWSLIPPCPERQFPYVAPQFYPSTFSFDSVGKRFFWECEAEIPMPNIVELKERIRSHH
jgi:5'-3' exonuclease